MKQKKPPILQGPKLSIEEVQGIKAEIALGKQLKKIAWDYDVDISLISRIKSGERWKDVQPAVARTLRLKRKVKG